MAAPALQKAEPAPFNFLPLTAPIPPGLLAEFKRTHRAWWPPAREAAIVAWSIVTMLVLGTCLLVIAAIAVWIIVAQATSPFVPIWTLVAVIALGLIAFIAYPMIASMRKSVHFGPGWRRMLRLDWFAHHNGMTYEFERRNPRLEGAIFSLGRNSVAKDILTVKSGRGVQIANYASVAKSSFDARRFSGGYVVIELDRRMPHMIAIAKRRYRLGRQNIAPGLLKSQVLSLEGDFDKYFTLYAPRQYAQDALYVFTPDLMALLIDRLGALDLEIVDNRLFLYSHTPFDLLDPNMHRRLATIVQVVGHKAANQTRNYSDHRTDPRYDVVAPIGRRLRYGISLGTVLLVLYIALRIFAALHTG